MIYTPVYKFATEYGVWIQCRSFGPINILPSLRPSKTYEREDE
jgi:hypothetical protein